MNPIEEIQLFQPSEFSRCAAKAALALNPECWTDPALIPETLTDLKWSINFLSATLCTAHEDEELKKKLETGQWTPYQLGYFALCYTGKARRRTMSNRTQHQTIFREYQAQIQTLHDELSSSSAVAMANQTRNTLVEFFNKVASIARSESGITDP